VKMLRATLARLAGLFDRANRERDFDAELESHLQFHIDDNLRAGMSPAEARRVAIVTLGGIQQVRERQRDQRGLPLVEQLREDLRFGLRLFAKNRGFTVVSLLTLTIGLGGNILIFSIGYPILTARLPGTDPDRLVRVYENDESNVFHADYVDFRDQNRTFSGLTAYRVEGLTLRTNDILDHVVGMVVTGNYFNVLGIAAAVGRPLTPADDMPDSIGAVVLSHAAWQQRFGGDPNIIGRPISVRSRPFTIVGVAPAEFLGTALPASPELWVTWHASGLTPSQDDIERRGGLSVQLIGRLRPGVSMAQAQADLSSIASNLAAAYPQNRGRTVNVYEGYAVSYTIRGQALAFLTVLLSLTVLVLGVTCVNLAGLQLARGAARRQEIGVRSALGASRNRLIRQLFTENMLLSLVACTCACLCVAAIARALSLWSMTLPGGVTLHVAAFMGWRVIMFAIVLSLGTAILVGLMPALRSSGATIAPSLNAASSATNARVRARSALIATQLAMSTVLIVLAVVLVRSLANARSVDHGFSTDGILSASLNIAERGLSSDQGAVFYDRLLADLQSAPGVIAASLVEIVPLTISNRSRLVFPEGVGAPAANADLESMAVSTNNISAGYLRTVGIPLLAGRDFNPRDNTATPNVAIVNETLARRFWPGEDPIGRRFRSWDGVRSFGPWIEVVGLVRDSKYATVGESPRPFFYRPLTQVFVPEVTMVVKTSADAPLTFLPTFRARLRAFDGDLAIFAVDTLERQTRLSLLPVQTAATLAGGLGAIALLLAAFGIYGVTAFVVRQRTREVGIRMALGGEPARVVRLLVWEGSKWAVAGVGVGLLGAVVSTRVVAGLLYGVSTIDPVAFGGVVMLLSSTACLACWLPARRAVLIDPARTLRAE
jgi:putative ABC transport system permease protein